MNKAIKIVIVLALIAVVGVVFALKQKDKTPASDSPPTADTTSVAKEQEKPPLEENAPPVAAPVKLPHLIDLGAGKCIPCKMMKPILDELKQNYKEQFKVTFIDVWEKPDEAKQYKINLIPTQIFFDAEGKELFRHEGFYAKEDILGKWKELGIALEAKGQ